MPIHDWTKVDAGIFHHFHNGWITRLSDALNDGLLPKGYYALAEQVKHDDPRPRRLEAGLPGAIIEYAENWQVRRPQEIERRVN